MIRNDNDELLPLVLELMTVCLANDEREFLAHVERRLDEELSSPEEAYRLIALLAAFGGNAVKAWAEDTDREPSEVLQAIGLDVAQSGFDAEGP